MSDQPYRVLVTGSRDWAKRALLYTTLNEVYDVATKATRQLVVVHGACPRGADEIASNWAQAAISLGDNVIEERHPADWQINGKRAGFIRNAHMVHLGADACLAFIRSGSKGASHTAALAERAGIPTRRWTS
ncbi:SLOG family protein [Streptomyces sp. NPDC054887]